MPKDDTVVEAVEDLTKAVQALFLLHAKQAGLSKEQARSMLGVDNTVLTRVWKSLPGPRQP